MKHAFILLLWLGFLGRLCFPAQAKTTSLKHLVNSLPTALLAEQTSARREASVLNATTATVIHYVKAGASGNGSSWSNASGDLQAMINASTGGDQVWIAGGTYKPGTSGLSNPRDAHFSLKNGVSVLGGFTGANGTEGNANARTTIPSSTTLSGDIGTVGVATDNVYHVINNNSFDNNFNSLDNSAVLDGVAITGGFASGGNLYNSDGGGMITLFSSPSIFNCLFSQNYAADGGGGVFNGNNGVAARFINCSFVNNSGGHGGAVYENSNSVGSIFTNCHFESNSGSSGGGLEVFQATGAVGTTLTNCTFRNNSPSAIYQALGSPLTLTNCLLWNNGGSNSISIGGGIFAGGHTITISYSALEPGATNYTDGGHNQALTSSPFANATGPELLPCALAIDAGNDAANPITTDGLGNPRKVRTIDIGAAEYQGAPTQPVAITGQAQSATTVCGSGQTGTFRISFSGIPPFTTTLFRDATQLNQASSGGGSSVTFAGVPLESGTYRMVITSGCNSETATYARITVNPLPTAYSVTGGGATVRAVMVSPSACRGLRWASTTNSSSMVTRWVIR